MNASAECSLAICHTNMSRSKQILHLSHNGQHRLQKKAVASDACLLSGHSTCVMNGWVEEQLHLCPHKTTLFGPAQLKCWGCNLWQQTCAIGLMLCASLNRCMCDCLPRRWIDSCSTAAGCSAVDGEGSRALASSRDTRLAKCWIYLQHQLGAMAHDHGMGLHVMQSN